MKRRKSEKNNDDNGFAEFGGYMAAKVAKLEDQFKKDASKLPLKSRLFDGISIFVNGYTKPSPEELKLLMAENGGVFHTYQRSWTTFVVANNLPDVKIRALGKDKVIKADWIVDSLKAGKILDYSKFLLYNEKSNQPSLFQFGTRKDETMVEPCKNSMDVQADLHSKVEDHAISTKIGNKISDKKATKCATDPGFIKEFFQKSRLHHIATLGANFKQYVTELRKKHSGGFTMRSQLLETVKPHSDVHQEKTTIMHIDMDCFFVSVGLLSRSHLRGKPVAVTHSLGSEGGNISYRPGANRELESNLYKKRLEEKLNKTNGNDEDVKNLSKKVAGIKDSSSLAEIASCSYEARKFGIHNGMFVGTALKLCPDLQTIPYDFTEYQEVAQTLYKIIAQYTLEIEAVSCDEMFVDLTELLISTKLDVMGVVSFLRNEIMHATGCPCSAGIGKNKLQARLATKEAKPNGQYLMQNIEEYIKLLPITDLPGVGYSTSFKLEKLGLKTCEDLQKLSLVKLHLEFGKKFGETLYNFCRGIDTRLLQLEYVRQSISVDVNYGIRFTKHSEVEFFLKQIAEELHDRMVEISHKGKKLTLKILIRAKDAPVETAKYLGTGLCDAVNKTILLQEATNDTKVIGDNIVKLYRDMKLSPEELRGIGSSMAKLETMDCEAKVNRIMELFKNIQPQPKQSAEHPKIEMSINSTGENDFNVTRNSRTPKKKGRSPKKVQTPIKGTLPNIFSKISSEKEENINGLDESFLCALPEDIRQEVIQNHKRLIKQESGQRKSIPKNEDPIVEEENSVNAENFDITVKSKAEISKENIFLRKDFANVIANWMSDTEGPTVQDVKVIKNNAKELIEHKQLSPVYLALKLLCRKICDQDCQKWHWFYTSVVDDVQSVMLVKYKRTLAVHSLACRKCKLNNP